MQYIAEKVITWHKSSGRHDLPWQKINDPYLIWISEIMLQQTQVSSVIPYYQRFIKTFPTVEKLAFADHDVVMKHWSGLGYYRRAKFIMQTAKIIVQQYQSKFPDSVEKLLSLPGIGKSTAGAICAFAFGGIEPIMDANVKRVFCRFYGIMEWPGKAQTQKYLWSLAEQNLPSNNIQIYTQALMDLGATLCKGSQPVCSQCPLQLKCMSFKSNLCHVIPAKKPKKTLITKQVNVLIVEANNQILFQKRSDSSVWEGLWSTPEIQDFSYTKKWIKDVLGLTKFNVVKQGAHLAIFSHYKLQLNYNHILLTETFSHQQLKDFLWIDRPKIGGEGIPTPIKKLLQNI
jgi:A/G-specific adenine glycosylase